jgi:hypothetical protein
MNLRRCAIAKLAVCLAAMSVAACADRGEMASDRSAYDMPPTMGATQVRVTGCFQEMTGFNNFVLSNIGDATGVAPSDTRAYRIEQSGELEQYIGKRVTIDGSVAAEDAAVGARAGRAVSGDLDFNELPELHVRTVTRVSDNCGAMSK